MEKKSPHVTCPASPQTLYMGQICCFFLVGFLEVFATLAQERPKTHGKKNMSPVQLLLRPSPWVNFFCVFLFSRGFCHLGPKMHQNQWKKQKESTRVTCPASPQTTCCPLPTGDAVLWQGNETDSTAMLCCSAPKVEDVMSYISIYIYIAIRKQNKTPLSCHIGFFHGRVVGSEVQICTH